MMKGRRGGDSYRLLILTLYDDEDDSCHFNYKVPDWVSFYVVMVGAGDSYCILILI